MTTSQATTAHRFARAVSGALVAGSVLTASLVVTGGSAGAASQVDRVQGTDRYETAAAISRARFQPGVGVVAIATGIDFPDALAAGGAAVAGAGPVLLVRRDEVTAATSDELRRLVPKRIIVVGGPSSVSETVLAQLRTFTVGSVDRVAGADRFATAAAVATSSRPGGAATVYVASGASFADALAAVPAIGAKGAALVLAAGDNLTPETIEAVRRLAPAHAVLVGGPSALRPGVESDVRSVVADVSRVAGATRFDTAVALSKSTFTTAPAVYLTTANAFADALGAGPAAFAATGALLPVTHDCIPSLVDDEISRLAPGRVTLVGGPGAIGVGVEQRTVCASGEYTFIEKNRDGSPVRWNPCEPLHYVVNSANSPANAQPDLDEAIRQVEAATGIDFVSDGATNEPPEPNRDSYQPARYGERWAPVLIAFTELGGAAGIGGPSSASRGSGPFVHVSGIVFFDPTTDFEPGFGRGSHWGGLMLHELAHMVGLDHVKDPRLIMHNTSTGDTPAHFGNGDLAGLSQLGRGAGCLSTPEPF